jgi:YesN/AraC family two-component response regulator
MQLKNEDIEKAISIKAFLEKNYQEPYDYAFLVKYFAINNFKLKVAFKYVTGDSIHSYITKIRITEAKKLLQTTNIKIELIAVKVGLDKSNFNMQFKKHTGVTPSHWRKNTNPDAKVIHLDTSSRNK